MKWLNANKELPEHGKSVWIYDGMDDPTLGWYSEHSKSWHGDLDYDGKEELDVEYWMPATIPNRPKV